MVRRCCVSNCIESDLTILAHRFPKGDEMAMLWQHDLNLTAFALDVLRQNYVVCTKHFSSKAYRNAISNSLNTTAVPNVDINSDNERIETTKTKNKSNDVPMRCHKSPRSIKTAQQQIINETEQPAKKQKFDIFDFEEPTEKLKEVNQIELTEQTVLLPVQESKHVQTAIEWSDKEIQTEKVEDATIVKIPSDSKDDKLISILYPDFDGMNKIDLIKMIIEKNQRIKSLEEEKQMLESAMRKLL